MATAAEVIHAEATAVTTEPQPVGTQTVEEIAIACGVSKRAASLKAVQLVKEGKLEAETYVASKTATGKAVRKVAFKEKTGSSKKGE